MSANKSSGACSCRKKLLIGIGVAFLLYTIVGFFVVPAIIKSQMLQRLPGLTKRQASVQEVKVNPFALSLTINGLALKETNGDVFAGWDTFYARFELWQSVFKWGGVFGEISFDHPYVQVTRFKDGTLNFENLLDNASASPAPAKKAKGPLPRLIVHELRIDGADLSVADLTTRVPVHTKLAPAHLHLSDFTTEPRADVPYGFTATSEAGESFSWSGSLSVDPMQVTGNFKVGALDLKKYSPYVGNFARVDVKDGKLDVSGDYKVILGDTLDLTLTKGGVRLTGLQVAAADSGEMIVTIPSLAVDIASASLAKKSVQVNSVKSAGGSLVVRRNHDGTINLLSLMNLPAAAPAATNAPVAAATPWVATVGDIVFTNYTINAEDDTPSKPARMTIDQLAFDCKGFSTDPKTVIPITASLRLNESGTFSTAVSVRLSPLMVDGTIDLEGLDMRPSQPYVQDQVKMAITDGLVSVHGHARYAEETDTPLMTFKGNTSLAHVATTDMAQFKDFVKFGRLEVNGIDFSFRPNKVLVDEVKLSGLSASIIIDSNKQPNLLAILPKKEAATSNAVPVAATTSDAVPQFPVSLGAFVLENASFHFSDQSIEPNCIFDIQQLDGTVKNLSTDGKSPAEFHINGKVDEFSPFDVAGKVTPPLSKDLTVSVTVSCKNTELTGFTPYMEKYAGYPLSKGKLLVALSYDIVHRNLSASNKVVISDLTLGARNSSPDATHLPVKLGIALLKDREGKIDLDVPLSGNLDDPKFRIGPIIWQVVENILVKAATSPFTLLGSLFGGGEEMSFVEFLPGQSDIPATEKAKVDKLSKALYNRPGLNLEIVGAVAPTNDMPALMRVKLDGEIKSLRAKELIAAGTPATNVEAIQIDATDRARLLKDLYTQTFGTNEPVPAASNAVATTNTVVPVTNAATIVASPPAARHHYAGVDNVRGAELLRLKAAHARSAPAPKLAEAPAVVTNAPPATAESPTLALTPEQLEASLLAQIQITDDDLRELIKARSHAVQAYLLESGKVAAERLFILAPKPINHTAPGETRANLSLE